ncbi:PREDICTED: E3 ubiquitin-protein ligase MSL2 isoform X2 [Papilio xuthus]|uniref:E3 ubiquitin-protein ligase MSL2 isoform X2 n=1 Tax=Papilio xuthus TaxID=66420 RepID=A0AAJ6ZN30_PAPXU|nr:PREDICTED: E3 ubiquitin-protein ligase MSL2 isoform X2 [Papilio xuthus]
MNAGSLYVSTCRLIILADAADKSSWTDLFRLVPYLRQSLSCTVCGNLLVEPCSPKNSSCQHHVCKKCKGGKKKLKPSCNWCKDYENYSENMNLRILLQCYKKLCEYFMSTDVYKVLLEEDEIPTGVNGGTVASSGLIDLVQEAAGYNDDYQSGAALSKSEYSILPCVYTNTISTQTQGASTSSSMEATSSNEPSTSKPMSNGTSLYSVMYAGTGNKITIKRKAVEESESPPPDEPPPKESKVRPHLSPVDSLQMASSSNPDTSPSFSSSMDSIDTDAMTMEEMEESLCSELSSSDTKGSVYSTQLPEVSPSLPASIMMLDEDQDSADDDESSDYKCSSSNENNEPEAVSPQSGDTQDAYSDVEVDV